MADSKISNLNELATAPDAGDLFVIVDVSDTSMSASGTTKKIQSSNAVPDSSTTVKGKVELATDAETITGSDTVRAVTPSNITAKIDTDGTLAGNSDTRIPSQKAVKTYSSPLAGSSSIVTVGTVTAGTYSSRVNPRTNTVASSGTPTINTDTTDIFTITALATAITSMTTNLSGTPVNGQKLIIRIKDDGTARAITWGASFASRGATLPTTTVLGKYLYVGLIYNSTASVWDCVALSQEV